MALAEVAPESTIEEQIRVSAGCLCSIKVDGKYLLISEAEPTVEANELGEYPLKPVGGAYESHDSEYWDAVGLHLPGDTNDIRGFIPNTPDAREAFSQAFRLRRGRNTDPQAEFDQELKPLLEPFLDGPLEQSDVEFRYRTTEQDDSPSSRADAKNVPTFHTHEIFDVIMSERVKEAIRKAVAAGTGLALLTEQQLYGAMVSDNQIAVARYGEDRRCYVPPHARYVVQPRVRTYPESHSDMNRSTAYRLARTIAFGFERFDPLPYHRITRVDLEMLRRYGNPELVDQLEESLIKFRLSVMASQIIGGASEGLLVYGTADRLKGAHEALYSTGLQMLGILGMISSDTYADTRSQSAKESIGEQLRKIVEGISQSHRQSTRIAHIDFNTMQFEFGEAAAALADAEKYSPLGVESGVATASILGALLAQERYDAFAITAGVAVTANTLTMIFERWRKQSASNAPDRVSGHYVSRLVGNFGDKLPEIIASLSAVLGYDWGLVVASSGLTAGHTVDRLKQPEEPQRGTKGLQTLRDYLSRLAFDLPTPELKREHGLRIVADEDLEVYHKRAYEDGQLAGKEHRYYVVLDEIENKLPPDPDGKTYPFAYFGDYTVALNRRVLIDEGSMILRGGVVNELSSQNDRGVTTVLRSLADELDHPHGTALLRTTSDDQLPDDVNLHAVPHNQMVRYYDCALEQHHFIAELPRMRAVLSEVDLRDSGMFNDTEIAWFNRGNEGIKEYRVRLMALYASKAGGKILLLDNVFPDSLSPDQCQSLAQFLSRTAREGKIILAGTNGIHVQHREMLSEQGGMGKVYVMKDLRFEEAR